MATTNQQLINGIETNQPILNDKITKGMEEYKNYLEVLKDEKFKEEPSETEEESIKRAETIYDGLFEMIKRNELSNKKAIEVVEILNEMIYLFNGIIRNTEDEKEKLAIKNDELIDIIINLEQKKTNKLIDQNPKKKGIYNGILENKEGELNERRIKTKVTHLKEIIEPITKPLLNNLETTIGESKKQEPNEIKTSGLEELRKEIEEIKRIQEQQNGEIDRRIQEGIERNKQEEEIKRMNTIINDEEMKQIETWSGMKIGNIIFDSDIDNWGCNTSVFDKKIINKSNLIFLIEDEDDNKFGGYINAKIDKIDWWTNDPKSFVFSLKLNGIINGMWKFDITEPQYSFGLCTQSFNYLFGIGQGDICICKENYKNQSYCNQLSYNYGGIQNALCQKEKFTPKRITAIQLI